MLASFFPECKDLQPENFCKHYKTYCKSMVNIRKACKKTCGLCKYSVGALFLLHVPKSHNSSWCTLALMKKSRLHAFLLLRITLLQLKVKDSASLPSFRIFPIHPCICNITVAPNRHQEPIRSKEEFPMRITRVLFRKFRVYYLVLRRPQLNLKAVILEFISRSCDSRTIL